MRRVLVLVLLAACKPSEGSGVPPAETPGHPRAPTRHAAGEQLDVNVPLASGEVLPIAELRGKVVLLALSDAAHRDAQVLGDYARLAEAHGDDLTVLVVSLDRDGWQSPVAPYVLGWDPEGALAARLHAAALPMVLVLDRDGRIAHQHGGADPGAHAQTIATVERLAKNP